MRESVFRFGACLLGFYAFGLYAQTDSAGTADTSTPVASEETSAPASVSGSTEMASQSAASTRPGAFERNSGAAGATAFVDNDIEYKPMGYGSVEAGQIKSGYTKLVGQQVVPIGHVWQQRTFGWFGYDVWIKKQLEIKVAAGGAIAYSTPQIGTEVQTMQTRQLFFVKMACAEYSFFKSDEMGLNMQVGYFPFKYSPDARNLGELLFRSNAYPLLVYSDFDYAQADLLGARAGFRFNIGGIINLSNDLLFHSETYSVPVQNWSLSNVLSAKILNAFTIGGGISLCNQFSVYQGEYGTLWMDGNYYPDTSNTSFRLANATDTALFDWKSTKVMARFSVDPKTFLPTGIFGKNDLVLYGEADFMGLRNYPLYYTDLKDRTFYSVGFNFPGFKIIDVINGEIEYCPDSSAFSDANLFGTNTPNIEPVALNSSTSTIRIKRNTLRWSVYLKKSVLDGHVSFIAQCARDHKKINFYYFRREFMSFMETLPTTDDLWWVFKTEFNF